MTSNHRREYYLDSTDRRPKEPNGRRYSPPESPRVRFPSDDPAAACMDRGRTSSRHLPPSPRDSSYSPSPSRSRSRPRYRSHSRRRSSSPTDEKKVKPWYQKKTLWTGLATLATVAAVIPTTVSAKASVSSSKAAHRAAKASEVSAVQVTKSAHASQQAAKGSLLSARAVTNSSVAQGHMDMHGRYTGPMGHVDAGQRVMNTGRRAIEAAGPPMRANFDRVSTFR